MDYLIALDKAAFFVVNKALHNAFLDKIMPFWRSMYFWVPLYVFFIAYMAANFGKKGWIFLLALGLTVGSADIVSSRLVKPTVKRLRPCNDEAVKADVALLVRCGSGYSFTSSHAANHFAAAVFLCLLFSKRRAWRLGFMAWAASIALGQVYVGVHYPLDIFCGAVLGATLAWGAVKLYRRLPPQYRLEFPH